MKKLILVLAILIVASPAFAVLDVNMVQLTGNGIQVYYKGADTGNLPRGFALVFQISSSADVCSINAYKTGESTPESRGYGIYPARILINTAGVVSNWGNPLAGQDDVGIGDQNLPSQNFVLEFGSLYSTAPNAPAADGNLCILGYEPNGATPSFTIKMTGESQYRITGGTSGTPGVIFEDGTTADVNVTLIVASAPPDCFQDMNAVPHQKWIDIGKPKSWCCPWQNRGDGTGDGSVTLQDLILLKSCYGTTYPAAGYKCQADSTHDGSVTLQDLIRLKSNYGTNFGSTCDSVDPTWKNDCGPNP